MTIKEAVENAGSEIFTLTKYLEDKKMEAIHGQRFRKMINTLQALVGNATKKIDEKKLSKIISEVKYVGMTKHYYLDKAWCDLIAKTIIKEQEE